MIEIDQKPTEIRMGDLKNNRPNGVTSEMDINKEMELIENANKVGFNDMPPNEMEGILDFADDDMDPLCISDSETGSEIVECAKDSDMIMDNESSSIIENKSKSEIVADAKKQDDEYLTNGNCSLDEVSDASLDYMSEDKEQIKSPQIKDKKCCDDDTNKTEIIHETSKNNATEDGVKDDISENDFDDQILDDIESSNNDKESCNKQEVMIVDNTIDNKENNAQVKVQSKEKVNETVEKTKSSKEILIENSKEILEKNINSMSSQNVESKNDSQSEIIKPHISGTSNSNKIFNDEDFNNRTDAKEKDAIILDKQNSAEDKNNCVIKSDDDTEAFLTKLNLVLGEDIETEQILEPNINEVQDAPFDNTDLISLLSSNCIEDDNITSNKKAEKNDTLAVMITSDKKEVVAESFDKNEKKDKDKNEENTEEKIMDVTCDDDNNQAEINNDGDDDVVLVEDDEYDDSVSGAVAKVFSEYDAKTAGEDKCVDDNQAGSESKDDGEYNDNDVHDLDEKSEETEVIGVEKAKDDDKEDEAKVTDSVEKSKEIDLLEDEKIDNATDDVDERNCEIDNDDDDDVVFIESKDLFVKNIDEDISEKKRKDEEPMEVTVGEDMHETSEELVIEKSKNDKINEEECDPVLRDFINKDGTEAKNSTSESNENKSILIELLSTSNIEQDASKESSENNIKTIEDEQECEDASSIIVEAASSPVPSTTDKNNDKPFTENASDNKISPEEDDDDDVIVLVENGDKPQEKNATSKEENSIVLEKMNVAEQNSNDGKTLTTNEVPKGASLASQKIVSDNSDNAIDYDEETSQTSTKSEIGTITEECGDVIGNNSNDKKSKLRTETPLNCSDSNQSQTKSSTDVLEPPLKKKRLSCDDENSKNSVSKSAAADDDDVVLIRCDQDSIDNKQVKTSKRSSSPFEQQLNDIKKPKIKDDDSNTNSNELLENKLDGKSDAKSDVKSDGKSDMMSSIPTKSTDLNVDFLKRFKKSMNKMTKTDLEELVLQKIVEAFVYKSDFSEMRDIVEKQEKIIMAHRTKISELSKQFGDLDMVHKRVIKDLEARNQQYVMPVKITRAVGLQVLIPTKRTESNVRKDSTDRSAQNKLSPALSLNASTSDQINRRGRCMQKITPMRPDTLQQQQSHMHQRNSIAASQKGYELNASGTFIKIAPKPISSLTGPSVGNPSLIATPSSPVLPTSQMIQVQTSPQSTQVSNNPNHFYAAKKTNVRIIQNQLQGKQLVQRPQQMLQQQLPTSIPSSVHAQVQAQQNSETERLRVPPMILKKTGVNGKMVALPGHSVTSTTVTSSAAAESSNSSQDANNIKSVIDLTDEDDRVSANLNSMPALVTLPKTNNPVTSARVAYLINKRVSVTPNGTNAQRVTKNPEYPAAITSMKPAPSQASNRIPSNVTQLKRHPAPLPKPPPIVSHPDWKAIPPRPTIGIGNDKTGIVISWSIDDLSDRHARISSYQIFAYQETSGPPQVEAWRHVGDVKAMLLPMAVTLTHFQEGQRYFFAVRAIDVYKRMGPFSLPKTWK